MNNNTNNSIINNVNDIKLTVNEHQNMVRELNEFIFE